ncbi:MAG: tagaturonate reductase [Daejeonella sp.]|uniref:tagaturonate reductase n=1 Tax=Daejeonella sp. TaxID=2805397 RepID=UPI003C739B74
MKLNKANLIKFDQPSNITVPPLDIFELPEKVLQFGTGVLLRGLPDYFIDKANRQGIFNGRIVVVKSTSKGGISEFDQQNCLYTICVRGIANQEKIEENIISSSISRVLDASREWDKILEFASTPDLEVIISNTTEIGIKLVEDQITECPPISFPGKLLAVLHRRYERFAGDKTKGLVILPTELIPDNGRKLKEIVVELARQNELDQDFINWLTDSNHFCNTLVDRIVPGKPLRALESQSAPAVLYEDELTIVAEVYKLWAIEGDEHVKNVLSFASADPGIIISPDIEIYRELKLRLLNGTHTLSCGLAFLAGIKTVKDAMDNVAVSFFISNLMLKEISGAIPYPVPAEKAIEFSNDVIDRFRNPHIEHYWQTICTNYTAKVSMRVLPVLKRYYELFGQAPHRIAFGFAAYILFMRVTLFEHGSYYGELNGDKYLIDDDKAPLFFKYWQNKQIKNLVTELFTDQDIWQTELSQFPGFAEAVIIYLEDIMKNGVLEALGRLDTKELPA